MVDDVELWTGAVLADFLDGEAGHLGPARAHEAVRDLSAAGRGQHGTRPQLGRPAPRGGGHGLSRSVNPRALLQQSRHPNQPVTMRLRRIGAPDLVEAPQLMAGMKRAVVWFPHNPVPPRTGAHQRCLSLLRGLQELGWSSVLLSSELAHNPWTDSSVEELKYRLRPRRAALLPESAGVEAVEACARVERTSSRRSVVPRSTRGRPRRRVSGVVAPPGRIDRP